MKCIILAYGFDVACSRQQFALDHAALCEQRSATRIPAAIIAIKETFRPRSDQVVMHTPSLPFSCGLSIAWPFCSQPHRLVLAVRSQSHGTSQGKPALLTQPVLSGPCAGPGRRNMGMRISTQISGMLENEVKYKTCIIMYLKQVWMH